MGELANPPPLSRCATVLLLLAVAAIGCSDGGVGTPSDEFSQLVSSVSDFAGDVEKFEAMFADEAVPPESERAEYGRYSFWAKQVSVSGDSARMTVEVSDLDDKIVGEVEWTAVREDGQWKFNHAPLP